MKNLLAKLLMVTVILSGAATLASAKTNSATASLTNLTMGGYGNYTIPAFSTQTHRIWLNPGYAEIGISGDGDTDLDLYIYDGYGNQVDRRNNYGDDEYAAVSIARGGYFKVIVKNLGGVYNDYVLAVR